MGVLVIVATLSFAVALLFSLDLVVSFAIAPNGWDQLDCAEK
jgi:hypothetical protein